MPEGPNNFFDSPGANPRYVEDQRRVLDNLRVGTIAETLPQEFYDFFAQNKNKEKASLKTSDGTLKLVRTKDVYMIRKLQPRKADSKFPIDAERVVGYYLIDDVNGTAWDVSQLWRENISGTPESTSQPEIVTTSNLLVRLRMRAGYNPDDNVLRVDTPSESHFIQRVFNRVNLLDEESSFIVGILDTPHEAGHRYQFNPNERKTLSGKYKVLMYVLNMFTSLGKVIDRLPIVGKGMQRERNVASDTERNANAFAVVVIRRLREQKLDLLRGVTNSGLLGVIESHFLENYEIPFKHIRGKGISQARRHHRNSVNLQQIAEDSTVLRK